MKSLCVWIQDCDRPRKLDMVLCHVADTVSSLKEFEGWKVIRTTYLYRNVYKTEFVDQLDIRLW